MQVELSADGLNDHWTIANQKRFVFALVWNNIRQHQERDENLVLIWHNYIAQKFSCNTYLRTIIICLQLTDWRIGA